MATLEKIPLLSLSSTDASTTTSVQQRLLSAFGPTGPGIMLISGLPANYHHQRRLLLDAANALPFIPRDQLQSLEFPALSYATGWSHGIEKFNGMPDITKASFYANPMFDDPSLGDPLLAEKYPFDMSPNCWPSAAKTEHLEPSFKSIGALISNTALLLAAHCDTLVHTLHPSHPNANSLHTLLSTSRAAKGRLLHYFPSTATSEPAPRTDTDSSPSPNLWCGYHNDHGALTGLLPAQYYLPNGEPTLADAPRDARSGLHVVPNALRTGDDERCGDATPLRATIPPDCLAFQVGEMAQILTGGVLRATPHAVVSPSSTSSKTTMGPVARVTFAMFLQPNPWVGLRLPDYATPSALHTSWRVPPLSERFRDGDTCGQFAARTIRSASLLPERIADGDTFG